MKYATISYSVTVNRNHIGLPENIPSACPWKQVAYWNRLYVSFRCCFTSTVSHRACSGRGAAQDGHLDFHTAPELCWLYKPTSVLKLRRCSCWSDPARQPCVEVLRLAVSVCLSKSSQSTYQLLSGLKWDWLCVYLINQNCKPRDSCVCSV